MFRGPQLTEGKECVVLPVTGGNEMHHSAKCVAVVSHFAVRAFISASWYYRLVLRAFISVLHY